MSKPIFKDTQAIKKKAEAYFSKTDLVAPASFRIYMGYEKSNLSGWKKTKPEHFNLIKAYERKILAKIEEYAIYGQAHPDIASKLVAVAPKRTFYADKFDKDGKCIAKGSLKSEENVVTITGKYNQIGAMFILKAYDRDQYIPELEAKQELNNIQDRKTIIINADNTSSNRIPLLPQTVDGEVKETANVKKKKN